VKALLSGRVYSSNLGQNQKKLRCKYLVVKQLKLDPWYSVRGYCLTSEPHRASLARFVHLTKYEGLLILVAHRRTTE